MEFERERERVLQRELGLLVRLDPREPLPELERGLGPQRPPAERVRVRAGFSSQREGLVVAPRDEEHGALGERVVDPLDLRARARIRRRQRAGAQALRVRAGLERRELQDRVGRPLDGGERALVLTGGGQQRDQPLRVPAALLEAQARALDHRRIAALLELVDAELDALRPPARGVVIEGLDQRAHRVVGEAHPRPQQRLGDAGARGSVPHPRERVVVGLTALERALVLHVEQTDRAGAEQHDPRERAGDEAPRRVGALERGQQRVDARVAALGRDLQAALEHASQPPRRGGAAGRRLQTAGGDVVRELFEGLAGEGPLPVERLPQRHAERELIGARIYVGADELLRRHVAGRPQDRAELGQLGRERVLVQEPTTDVARGLLVLAAREAEVHDARAAVRRDHDVVGL